MGNRIGVKSRLNSYESTIKKIPEFACNFLYVTHAKNDERTDSRDLGLKSRYVSRVIQSNERLRTSSRVPYRPISVVSPHPLA